MARLAWAASCALSPDGVPPPADPDRELMSSYTAALDRGGGNAFVKLIVEYLAGVPTVSFRTNWCNVHGVELLVEYQIKLTGIFAKSFPGL